MIEIDSSNNYDFRFVKRRCTVYSVVVTDRVTNPIGGEVARVGVDY